MLKDTEGNEIRVPLHEFARGQQRSIEAKKEDKKAVGNKKTAKLKSTKALEELEGSCKPLSRDGIEVRLFDLDGAATRLLCLRHYLDWDQDPESRLDSLRRYYQSDAKMARDRRRWIRRQKTYSTPYHTELVDLANGRITVALKVLVDSRSPKLGSLNYSHPSQLMYVIREWRRLTAKSISATYEAMEKKPDSIQELQICIEDMRDKTDDLKKATSRLRSQCDERGASGVDDPSCGEIVTPEPYQEKLDEMGHDHIRGLLVQLSQAIGEDVVSKMLTNGNGGQIIDMRDEGVTS